MKLLLSIVISSWLLSLGASCGALAFCLSDSLRRRKAALSLAVCSIIIGYLGFGRWSPFHFFPQVGYVWTSGSARLELASSWFFVAPLTLGMLSMALLLARKMKQV